MTQPLDYEFPHIWPQPGSVNPAAVFSIAVNITLAHEGGHVHDPDDPGGETNFGISGRSYPDIDIAGLTKDDARKIYFLDFWAAVRLDRLAAIAPDLAIKCFDLGVNCGPKNAIRMLQRAVNTVCYLDLPAKRTARWRQLIAGLTSDNPLRVDGLLGPITEQAIRLCPHDRALMAALKGEAYIYYKEKNPIYVAGWLNRLES